AEVTPRRRALDVGRRRGQEVVADRLEALDRVDREAAEEDRSARAQRLVDLGLVATGPLDQVGSRRPLDALYARPRAEPLSCRHVVPARGAQRAASGSSASPLPACGSPATVAASRSAASFSSASRQ